MKAFLSGTAIFAVGIALAFTPTWRVQAEVPDKAAPTPSNANWSYGEFAAGSSVYVFGTDVPLRDAPSTSGRVLATLSQSGPSLLVRAKDEATYRSSDGYRDHWYKVKTGDGSEGFIWGGSLAKAALGTDLDGDKTPERVLVGIRAQSRNPAAPSDEVTPRIAEVRVLQAGKVVSSAVFPTIEVPETDKFGYCLLADALGDKGLPGAPRLIRVRFEYGACDYPSGSTYLAWTGKTLAPILTVHQVGNEQGSDAEEAIFPRERGGKAGGVVLVHTVSRVIEDKAKLVAKPDSVTRRFLRWNGRTLVADTASARR